MAGTSPLRTCIGCRTRHDQEDLVPLALIEGTVVPNERGKGRGAWICRDATCIEAAGKTRAFSRGFRSKLPDGFIADTLLGWLGNAVH